MYSFVQRVSLFLKRYHQVVFYGIWLLLNLLQAGATELFDDEAYYWVYSRFPAWGYFDHPPMVAILVRLGFAVFHNELGVRLLIVIMNAATIFVIQRLLTWKNPWLFYAIALSMAVAQIGGIIAVPDTPLLFFTALFFLQYRRFLSRMDIRNTVLLGLMMALMLYSKYHGVLIVFFTLLSNWKLLTRYQAYLAILIASVLFLPHLYWQYVNDFPSVSFHLFERSAANYRINYTTDYIIGQIALAGPFTGWLLIWAAFRHKPQDLVERALQYSMAGVYMFFLLSTLRGHVEANWTVTVFIALMVLGHQYMLQHPWAVRWLYRLLPLTMLIVLIVRIYMMVDVAPASWLSKDEFHRNRVYVNKIQEKADGSPVVLLNSYQHASKLWFYGHGPTLSLNTAFYRRNNFNFWPIEDSLIGKKVYVDIDEDSVVKKRFFEPRNWTFPTSGYRNDYFSFSRVLLVNTHADVQADGTITVSAKVKTPKHYLTWFRHPVYSQAPIWLILYKDGNVDGMVETGLTVQSIKYNGQELIIHVPQQWPAGEYIARLCIGSCIQGFPSINSTDIDWTIR